MLPSATLTTPIAANASSASSSLSSQPSNISPTSLANIAEQERKLLETTWGKAMIKDESWFIISKPWFQQWCDYTGFSAKKDTVEKSGAPRPGIIDNSNLVFVQLEKEKDLKEKEKDSKGENEKDLKVKNEKEFKDSKKSEKETNEKKELKNEKIIKLELKRDLVLGKDYELIHSESWALLSKWYNFTNSFERQVITIGTIKNSERVEMHPTFFQISIIDQNTAEPVYLCTRHFSNYTSLNEIIFNLASSFIFNSESKTILNLQQESKSKFDNTVSNKESTVKESKAGEKEKEFKSNSNSNSNFNYFNFNLLLEKEKEGLFVIPPKIDNKKDYKSKDPARIWIRSPVDSTISTISNTNAVSNSSTVSTSKTETTIEKKDDKKKTEFKTLHGWKMLYYKKYAYDLETLSTLNIGSEIIIEFRKPDETWAVKTSPKTNWKEFEIGDMLDCKDEKNFWYQAIIIAIKGELLQIHFINWQSSWDEWISKDSKRLAPQNLWSTGPHEFDPDKAESVNTIAANFGPGICGLQNLGNTCFMNSTIQCLSNANSLTKYFMTKKYLQDLNTTNPLGWGGNIAMEYAKLISDIWSGKFSIVTPKSLKDVIGQYQARFVGNQQHDSSELLSFLLDGLHEDLNKIKNKPATTPVESNGRADQIVAKEAWDRHLLRNKSVVVDTCQGQLKSRVICPECKRESITFDPFMFLTVPLPESLEMIQVITLTQPGLIPKKYAIKCAKNADIIDIKKKLSKMAGIDESRILVVEIWQNRIYKILYNDMALNKIQERDDIWAFYCPLPNVPQPENWIQVQMSHCAGTVSHPRTMGVSTVINLNNQFLTNYPNEEIHKICKDAITGFIKGGWTNDEVVPYDVYLFDKETKHPHCEIPKEGFTNMIQNGTFSIVLHWKNNLRWIDSPEIDVSIKEAIRENKEKKKMNLESCMNAFTREEVLRKSEAWYCSQCKTHIMATKKLDIFKTPDVLIIHLKRFNFMAKIDTMVDFPIDNLDIKSWIINPEEKNTVYDLFAVSNHFGSLGGGHYTAYVKNVNDGKWYDMNDKAVTPIQANQVQTSAAYVLFYQRKSSL